MREIQGFSDLVGHTLVGASKVSDERIEFVLADGRKAALHHWQECCEHVTIEDIAGDLENLVGAPIAFAEESSNSGESKSEDAYDCDSHTWTFYRIGTVKGSVVIRWYGSSNGYYSEGVDFSVDDIAGPPHA
jgi:hypothetical protein